MPDDAVLAVNMSEAARRLGVSVRTIATLIARRELPSRKIGRRRVIPIAALEAFDIKGEFRAICGGGRYDHLIKQVSGGKVDLPALGFGMGDVVLFELLKSRGLLPPFTAGLSAYVLIEDESLRADSLRLVQQLREAGLATEFSLTPAKGDKQFKRALELGATD